MTAAQRESRRDVAASRPARNENEHHDDTSQRAEKASSADEPYRAFEWFKLKSSDWLASTRGLSLAEAGALVTLRAMIHERGEPLNEDYTRLGRQCGAPSAKALQRIVDSLIGAKLLCRKAGGLWCEDIAEQIDHQRGVSQAAKQNRSKVGKNSQQNQSKGLTGVRRYKSKIGDLDKEGCIPSGDTPHSNTSESYTVDDRKHSDTRPEGASVHDQQMLKIGDKIPVGRHGNCIVDDFGQLGGESFVRLYSAYNRHIRIIVPVGLDRMLDTDSADDESTFQSDEIRWGCDIGCAMPHRPGRATDAA